MRKYCDMKQQRIAAGAVIFNKSNEMLFVKRTDSDNFMPGYWEWPGGGIEFGEEIAEGLKREVIEECGLSVTVSYPLAVDSYYIKENNIEEQRFEITFLCELMDYSQSVVLSREHTSYQWLPMQKAFELHFSDYLLTILKKIREHPLIQQRLKPIPGLY